MFLDPLVFSAPNLKISFSATAVTVGSCFPCLKTASSPSLDENCVPHPSAKIEPVPLPLPLCYSKLLRRTSILRKHLNRGTNMTGHSIGTGHICSPGIQVERRYENAWGHRTRSQNCPYFDFNYHYSTRNYFFGKMFLWLGKMYLE